jgi:predicted small lipoprotein YifL
LFRLVLAGALIASFSLSACGRKGALEAPPSATASDSKADKADKDAATKPDRPFFLDPLI